MSWHCSLALVEEFSAQGCLDTESCAQLNTNRTALKSSCDDRKKGTSIRSLYGTMLEPSMVNRGVEKWISCLGDSPASHSPQQENEKGKEMSGTCGRIPSASFAKLDPPIASSKMSQDSCPRVWVTNQKDLFTILAPYCETWRKAGTMLNGVCYLRPNAERPLSEAGSGLSGPNTEGMWPSPVADGDRKTMFKQGGMPLGVATRMWLTPKTQDAANRTMAVNSRGDPQLSGQVKLYPSGRLPDTREQREAAGGKQTPQTYPTPRVCSGKRSSGSNRTEFYRTFPTPRGGGKTGDVGMCGGTGAYQKIKSLYLPEEEKKAMAHGKGGALNPGWVEWLMGWPIGWTDLKPLATDRFRKWLELHGSC